MLKSAKCLIVDDSREDREYGKEILNKLGFKNVDVVSTDVALDQCKSAWPEMLLLNMEETQ